MQVAKGWTSDAKRALPDLLIERPDDPAVMFLHASLVGDPSKALPLYERIVERYPNSEWADDAMLRIIIQTCAAKDSLKATKSFQQLRTQYSNSELLPVAHDVMRSTVGVPPATETGNQKPETGNQKPETGNQKPETGNQKPETGNQQPTATIESHPYTLALTTTPDKKEADGMVSKYTAKNLRVNAVEKWIKGKRHYVVQVGWYVNELEAAADIDAVRKICSCKPIVARRLP
jgi:septal ring-binding cell division protein DamX